MCFFFPACLYTIGTAKENDGNSATVPDLEHASSLHAKPGHTQLKKMAVDNLHQQKPRQISNALFSVTKENGIVVAQTQNFMDK